MLHSLGMVHAMVKRIFSAAWIALLTTGAAGGFTFLVVASGLTHAEDLAARLLDDKRRRMDS